MEGMNVGVRCMCCWEERAHCSPLLECCFCTLALFFLTASTLHPPTHSLPHTLSFLLNLNPAQLIVIDDDGGEQAVNAFSTGSFVTLDSEVDLYACRTVTLRVDAQLGLDSASGNTTVIDIQAAGLRRRNREREREREGREKGERERECVCLCLAGSEEKGSIPARCTTWKFDARSLCDRLHSTARPTFNLSGRFLSEYKHAETDTHTHTHRHTHRHRQTQTHTLTQTNTHIHTAERGPAERELQNAKPRGHCALDRGIHNHAHKRRGDIVHNPRVSPNLPARHLCKKGVRTRVLRSAAKYPVLSNGDSTELCGDSDERQSLHANERTHHHRWQRKRPRVHLHLVQRHARAARPLRGRL